MVRASGARWHYGNIRPSSSWRPVSCSSRGCGCSQSSEKKTAAPGGQSSAAEERSGMPAGRMAVTALAVTLH